MSCTGATLRQLRSRPARAAVWSSALLGLWTGTMDPREVAAGAVLSGGGEAAAAGLGGGEVGGGALHGRKAGAA